MASELSSEISGRYKKYTDRQHALSKSGMYIGNCRREDVKMWVIDEDKAVLRDVSITKGAIKLAHELIDNAHDNIFRGNTTHIDIAFKDNTLTITNNGKTIPVIKHDVHEKFIPEMLASEFRAGDNMEADDRKGRVTAGTHGLGMTLVNTFSKAFKLTCDDAERKLQYTQSWSDNMQGTSGPKVKKMSRKNSKTIVEAVLDWQRLGYPEAGPDGDFELVLKRQAFDLAACTPKTVKVTYNGQAVPVKSFAAYCKMFGPNEYVKISDTCEVAVFASQMQQLPPSFVNGLNTIDGKHKDALQKEIVSALVQMVQRKLKIVMSRRVVQKYIVLSVNCHVEDPEYDSQTKERLTGAASESLKFKWPQAGMKRVMKLLEDVVCTAATASASAKLSSSVPTSRKVKVPKYDTAHRAGTKDRGKCALYLSEGDSAKALVVSGFSVIGRKFNGVFPLKGKLINCMNASQKELTNNAEFTNICTILGLKPGKPADPKTLRYGKVVIMCDQDVDGSHIKGLILAMFYKFWPNLITDGFLWVFVTPLVKAKKGKIVHQFFDQSAFEKWESENDTRGFTVKYYKGLGTSSSAEARQMFSNLDTHLFQLNASTEELPHLALAFDKTKSKVRRDMIANVPDEVTGTAKTVKDFVMKELIQFFVYACERGIPSVMDGLKPSQRKTVFTMLTRTNSEIKVAQLAPYVAGQTKYHHGENSLNQTIINMARTFVGSNNINLLEPLGQFGTRIQGGKDHASPRYIFTKLCKVTKLIYRPEDLAIAPQQREEGQAIEPKFLPAVIPMLLVNGAKGIACGWSTSIPAHNPIDLIQSILSWLDTSNLKACKIFYKGFAGTYSEKHTHGVVSKTASSKFHVTELPIGTWTEDFKESLAKHDAKVIDQGTETTVDLVIKTKEDMTIDEFKAKFKMASLLRSLWVAHGADNRIVDYRNSDNILQEFVKQRLPLYEKRRQYLLSHYDEELSLLKRKLVFVACIVVDKINLAEKSKVIEACAQKNLTLTDDDDLFKMTANSIIGGHVKLQRKIDAIQHDIEVLTRLTAGDLWKADLNELLAELQENVVRASAKRER